MTSFLESASGISSAHILMVHGTVTRHRLIRNDHFTAASEAVFNIILLFVAVNCNEVFEGEIRPTLYSTQSTLI
jgi:hypothetical protein